MRFVRFLVCGFIVVGSARAAVRGDLSLAPSLRAQGVEAASGPEGQFAARYWLGGHLALEGIGRTGLAFVGDKIGDEVLYVGLIAGVAYAPRGDADAWAPRAALRLTHIHHAPVGSWRETPGSNIAGDSDGGVQHRSGLEGALGLAAPRWAALGEGWATGLDLELTVGYLPNSDVLGLSVGIGVGLAFFTVGG